MGLLTVSVKAGENPAATCTIKCCLLCPSNSCCLERQLRESPQSKKNYWPADETTVNTLENCQAVKHFSCQIPFLQGSSTWLLDDGVLSLMEEVMQQKCLPTGILH